VNRELLKMERQCSVKKIEEDISEYYECVMTPINASEDSKTGFTFKGSDADYLKAHGVIMQMIQKKGDRFVINGVEISIVDAPQNKPVCIGIKPKNGLTGKANLKVYALNKNGGATMHVTKIRGGNMAHVKALAYNVVKYILDSIISGEITTDDVENMRKKGLVKAGKKTGENKCDLCENSFASQQGLRVHITKMHKITVGCASCDLKFANGEELKTHNQKVHSQIRSPVKKKIKSSEVMDVEEKDDIEMMDVDEELVKRSIMHDEKVRLMQKKFDDEENSIREVKRKHDVVKHEEIIETKNSLRKKKNKKKIKQNKINDNVTETASVTKDVTREIPKKYFPVLKEEGIDGDEYCIYGVKPDGACGSTCTGLHCHRDRKLGKYVRRNINEYFVKFWPFFQPFFEFPIDVKVGFDIEPFADEESFLEFLKTGKKSGLILMDHHGWQVVANMYQISIHILTTRIQSMEEPKVRWMSRFGGKILMFNINL
jgi:hypothetical protein